MANTGDFDIVLQFRPAVVNDIITRQLSDPTALKAQAQKLIQRHLTLQAVLPSELSWSDPTVDCADHDMLLASVAISGGIRPAVLNHNLTLSASVQMPLMAVVRQDDAGSPYIAAQISSADALALRDVRLGLAGKSVPAPLAGIDLSQVTAPLRPFLAQNLLQSLARLAHTYMLGSIPACFPTSGYTTSATDLRIIHAGVRTLTDKGEEALALGLSLTNASSARQAITSAFGGAARGNAALVVSAVGLNQLIEQARTQGRLQGSTVAHGAAASTPWRWTALSCAPSGDGRLDVSGRLVAIGQDRAITARVTCAIDEHGRLVVTPNSPVGDTDEITMGAIRGALLRALSIGDSADGRFWQSFSIPDSSVSLNAAAQSLRIESGGVTLLYDVPLSKDKIDFQFPVRKPAAQILQLLPLPIAASRGAPLTVTLRAQVVSESFPPYDFEWQTDSTPAPTEGAERRVVQTPADVRPGTHTLTTVRLRMIDLIGQVATDEKPVQYVVRPRKRLGRVVAAATILAVIATLALGGLSLANGQLNLPVFTITNVTPKATATPTPTLTPTPAPQVFFTPILRGDAFNPRTMVWSQACGSSKLDFLIATELILDNTHSNASVTWTISLANDPTVQFTPDQIWATVSDLSSSNTSLGSSSLSGTTLAGSITYLKVTPAPQLCTWLTAANPSTTYSFMLSLTYTPSNPDAQQPITFTDSVTPPPPPIR